MINIAKNVNDEYANKLTTLLIVLELLEQSLCSLRSGSAY